MLCFYFLHTPGTDRVRDETKTWNCFFSDILLRKLTMAMSNTVIMKVTTLTINIESTGNKSQKLKQTASKF